MSTPQQQLIDYIRDVSRPFRSSLAGMGRSEQEFMPHFERIVQLALSDLCALVQKDPAARGRPAYVWHAYGSIKAVVDYRVAHEIFAFAPDAECAELFQSLARELSEDSKQRSGIEIHPAARIGPGFIVDHGLGTVIGETAELGSDCVVLQGVVLGALGTSVMTDGRRHPRLGDRVQVCSFAKVLGPVTVGDGSFIGPECLVLRDMPASAAGSSPATAPSAARAGPWCTASCLPPAWRDSAPSMAAISTVSCRASWTATTPRSISLPSFTPATALKYASCRRARSGRNASDPCWSWAASIRPS